MGASRGGRGIFYRLQQSGRRSRVANLHTRRGAIGVDGRRLTTSSPLRRRLCAWFAVAALLGRGGHPAAALDHSVTGPSPNAGRRSASGVGYLSSPSMPQSISKYVNSFAATYALPEKKTGRGGCKL